MFPPLLIMLCAAFLIYHGVTVYNKLNVLREDVREAEGNIEVCMSKITSQTKKLVELATRYGLHEKNIFLQISQDRRLAQQSAYQQAIHTIAIISKKADGYPSLKADQAYLQLMGDLTALATETQKKYEDHNKKAKIYNTTRTSFPTLLSSSVLGFSRTSYLDQDRWYPRNSTNI